MFHALSEALSNYFLFKEITSTHLSNEQHKQTRKHKPYAYFLPVFISSWLFVIGLSLIETRKICGSILLVVAALIGIIVLLCSIKHS